MELSLRMTLPSSEGYIAIVRLVVASLAASRRNLAAERIDDLKLAVSEACTNAIEANRAAGGSRVVEITLWEGAERMEVCITDSGSGFDPADLPEHPPVTDPERLNFERGLGIPLMRSLVDELRFDPTPEGTSVWMTLFGGPAGDAGDETGEIIRVVTSEDT